MSRVRDWATGGKWKTVTRGRGWEEAPGVLLPVVALFVDGLVLVVLVLARRVQVMLCQRGGKGDEAGYAGCGASLAQGSRSIVLDKWDGGKTGSAIDEAGMPRLYA